MKKGKSWFFTPDAVNLYWAIPVGQRDEYKLEFVMPYGMYYYTVMGQGLPSNTHTYSWFRDLVFGNNPEGVDDHREVIAGFSMIIGDCGDVAFDRLFDNSYSRVEPFKQLYQF